jgi:hypothetical protein
VKKETIHRSLKLNEATLIERYNLDVRQPSNAEYKATFNSNFEPQET